MREALAVIDDARVAIINLSMMKMLTEKANMGMKEQDLQQTLRDKCISLVDNAVLNWSTRRNNRKLMMLDERTSPVWAGDEAIDNAMRLVQAVSDISPRESESGIAARCTKLVDTTVNDCCEYMKRAE